MVHLPIGEWIITQKIDTLLYAQDSKRGLVIYQNGKWILAANQQDFNKKIINRNSECVKE